MHYFFISMQDALLRMLGKVKSIFTPSEFTREMVRTESKWWWVWMVFIVTINFVSGVQSCFAGKYNEGFLYILVAALFALMAHQSLLLNMARKTSRSLVRIARDQANMIDDLLDERTAR